MALNVMRAIRGVPATALIGISIISLFTIWFMLNNAFGVALVLCPFLFVIFRLFKADNSARWFVSVLLLVWGLVVGNQFWTYHTNVENNGLVASSPPEIEIRTKTNDVYIHIASIFGVLVLAVGLLHTPSSRKWFKGSPDDA